MSSRIVEHLQSVVQEQARALINMAAGRGYMLKITKTYEGPMPDGVEDPGHCYGISFDVAFQGDDPMLDKMRQTDPENWAKVMCGVGLIGEECGLIWGGRAEDGPDVSHFQTSLISLEEAKKRWPLGWAPAGYEAPEQKPQITGTEAPSITKSSIPGAAPDKAGSLNKGTKRMKRKPRRGAEKSR